MWSKRRRRRRRRGHTVYIVCTKVETLICPKFTDTPTPVISSAYFHCVGVSVKLRHIYVHVCGCVCSTQWHRQNGCYYISPRSLRNWASSAGTSADSGPVEGTLDPDSCWETEKGTKQQHSQVSVLFLFFSFLCFPLTQTVSRTLALTSSPISSSTWSKTWSDSSSSNSPSNMSSIILKMSVRSHMGCAKCFLGGGGEITLQTWRQFAVAFQTAEGWLAFGWDSSAC